ncbi:MAG TPA: cell division protein ZapE [Steroidobacteraceae bacterium]|nr:cell division protein ZapE [Steroidobacteraceae bacterium]
MQAPDEAPLGRAYRESLKRHGYTADPAQQHAVERLEDLRRRLLRSRDSDRGIVGRLRRLTSGGSPELVRGLYLWGGVGRGKTFLMDLFHLSSPVPARRAHFHRFMKDVHARLRALRDVENPLAHLAREMSADSKLLCLDELFVSDIADAMILGGLFEGLLENGATLVFTSNLPPAGLYRDGLQRARFLPAIALIERHCEVLPVDGGIDYRLRELEQAPLYLTPDGPDAQREMQRRFEAIAGDKGSAGGELEVEGRAIAVRRCTTDVVWFDFAAICDGPRSQADYIEIASDYHAVFISGVPRFDATLDNQARRFIALVDEFYDRNVKLVLSAAVPAEQLYRGERLGFEFERTRSRLKEMQSHEYLARAHRS